MAWTLAATLRAERGEDHLPTGRLLPYDPQEGPFDDAFVVPTGRAGVRWPGAVALEIDSSGGWFVVFDELPWLGVRRAAERPAEWRERRSRPPRADGRPGPSAPARHDVDDAR